MPRPQHNRSNRRQPRYQHNVGSEVYFHAQQPPGDEQKCFMCKAIVLRQPNRDSRVYKLVIVAVSPDSVGGHYPELANKLLGKRIPRNGQHLQSKPTYGLLGNVYQQHPWLELKEQEIIRIKNRTQK